jgi:hypothetical protein
MKVLFHTNTLNYRGTTVATVDYARYNKEILGNESIISYNESIEYVEDMGSEVEVIDKLKHDYEIVAHKNLNHLEKIISEHKIDVAYFMRYGTREYLPQNCKTAVHAVFQAYEPHGDRYAYISEWLSRKMTGGSTPFVPHTVELPQPNMNLRESLGIPKEKIVLGRLGGLHSFDIPWVQKTIEEVSFKNKNLIFLFINTKPFCSSPNVIYLNPTSDLQSKSNFINACDAMIHGRARGESFGCAMFEFLYLNKPVIACTMGEDQNHTETLKDTNTLYSNPHELVSIISNIQDIKYDWKKLCDPFLPEKVIRKFESVFLKNH